MGVAAGRKSIFITGGASGIGAETARYFADRGWFVGLFDIDEAGLSLGPPWETPASSGTIGWFLCFESCLPHLQRLRVLIRRRGAGIW